IGGFRVIEISNPPDFPDRLHPVGKTPKFTEHLRARLERDAHTACREPRRARVREVVTPSQPYLRKWHAPHRPSIDELLALDTHRSARSTEENWAPASDACERRTKLISARQDRPIRRALPVKDSALRSDILRVRVIAVQMILAHVEQYRD